ncbi:MAG: acetylglutamate kinase [Bacteroidetes bacterium]|nr:acetylglutamate kinase [Bacteroidota bacterium]
MLIVKIGGGRDINIGGIARDLADIPQPAIIVHGANAWRDALAEQLHVHMETITSVRGYDSVLSTQSSLDLMLMAYAGLRNKRLVESFQRHGIPAVGLSGLDGRMIQGKRNGGIQCRQGGKIIIRHDLSGKPLSINTRLLDVLLGGGYIPVLTVPICDEDGFAISADNDDIVAVLHAQCRASTVVHLLEAPGFLADPADPCSLLPRMTVDDVRSCEGRSKGRIKRKLHAICRLLEEHPTRVILADGRTEHPLRDALAGYGTTIEAESSGSAADGAIA